MKQLPGNTPNACLLASLGGALSSILGLSVLFGWYTHNVSLIQVSPVFVPMQFNTALGILLSGLGLLLIIRGHRRTGLGCGIFVLLLGLLTLIEYIFEIDLSIDQLLMQHYITTETSSPGRMAPNTALCFSLTGAALAVIATGMKIRQPTLITSGLASLTFGLGFVGLTGYLSNFDAVYGWGDLTRMAVHTASGFMILGVAVTSLAWHRDAHASSGIPRWFPLPVGVGIATVIVSLWQAFDSYETQVMQQFGTSGMLPAINDVLLVVGMVLAATLSALVYLVQSARDRARVVAEMNSRLKAEIDERKRAREDLLQSEERWQFALEGNRDGVWDWNVVTDVVFFSRRWKEMLGYAEGEIANE